MHTRIDVVGERRKSHALTLPRVGLLALGALSLWLAAMPAQADAYYDEGLRRFRTKDYKTAVAYFEQSISNAPWDSSAFYYAAYTYQMLGDWNKAKEKYGIIVDRFPGTQACVNATAVLKRVDPAYFTRKKPDEATAAKGAGKATAAAGDTGSGPEADPFANVEVSGPPQSRLQFVKSGEKMYVDVQINGRNFRMVLGIGQDRTVLSKKDWVAAGFPLPKGAATRKAGQSNPSLDTVATVRAGEVTEKGLPLDISDAPDSNMLGEGFFKKLNYVIDPSSNQIKMTMKGAAASVASYSLPFQKVGDDMIVNVSVNGRGCNMVFDTAGSEIIIPKKRAREFGIDVQESSAIQGMGSAWEAQGPQRGEAGFGDLKRDVFGEVTVRVGPISKTGVKAKIDETSTQAKVGAGMFNDWQFSVDQTAKVIRFHR